ncbi:DapH/DapD/GlmU-related protein [Alkalibacterium thalassium]|uniref:Acetyltransferase (Isoleucine patch superfamily) n=1 Tax=Alkalibacterium thalassium TaxID=426701 RepID=A0A1G9BMK3_9LACT|nr:DapH/DapD/GlmU-related protein [Alkalibacterium thalassium]SDK40374.1 Acetyltransferase (isoleucine patch superfamily) [Alkalibacterium thalassium]
MKNGYGLGEIIKNSISLVYTKIFFEGARLIRRPIYIRGKKFLRYGKGFTTGYGCRLEMFNIHDNNNYKLVIGTNCKIGDYVHFAAGESVTIGDNCLFASKIYISDISHGDYSNNDNASNPDTPPDERPLSTNPVTIGDNVWLGDNVCILPGVKIGNGVVVGANAVVNKDIPDDCIAVGIPAKVIKKFNNRLKIWEKSNDEI